MAPPSNAVYGAIGAAVGAAVLLWSSSSGSQEPTVRTRAVYVVAQPVRFAGIDLTQMVHDNITREIGMSIEAVSHWGVLIINDETGEAFQWDLMSDNLLKPFKNVVYRTPITAKLADRWSHFIEIGHTTKTDAEIKKIG